MDENIDKKTLGKVLEIIGIIIVIGAWFLPMFSVFLPRYIQTWTWVITIIIVIVGICIVIIGVKLKGKSKEKLGETSSYLSSSAPKEYKMTPLGSLSILLGILGAILAFVPKLLLFNSIGIGTLFPIAAIITGLIASDKGDKTGEIGALLGGIGIILYVVVYFIG